MSSTEPTITCPSCHSEIKLTESLAAPLIESTRHDYEKRLAQKDADVLAKERKLAEREEQIRKSAESLDEQVAQKLKSERTKIASDESRKARAALADEFDEKIKTIAELQGVLTQKEKKLAEAQNAQAELIRKQRELDDAKREMELTIEKRVQENLTATRAQAKKEAEDQLALKVSEKELIIASMQKQIEDLKRKAEQGSQQLQGEVLELQLESLLGGKFPLDRIDPVPKGQHGGDILQRVVTPTGQSCGTILWETKRTKNWADGWLAKLRNDQRAANAEIAVIVSTILPKGVESFFQIDGVWVTHPTTVFPVAFSLRQMLIEVSCARQANQGQQTKIELVYQYLLSPKFRLRMQAIVEAYSSMKDDLQKEKTFLMRQWAKREAHIDHAIEGAAGMYGELQGIAGQTLQEIEGLEPKLLDGDA